MDIQARRIFRLSLTMGLALGTAYGLNLVFAFLAPLFAFIMTLRPAPPMKSKALLTVLIMISVTTGVGLLLVPLLLHFPVSAILVVALGLYFAFYLTIYLRQATLGLFITMGFTLISAAGYANFALGQQLIISLISGITIAIICQWLVYPFFPEDELPRPVAEISDADLQESRWIALRGTLIVLPVYLLALNNPSLYIAAIMKSVSLGQQASKVDAAHAGRELLGSTLLAGWFAMLFWFALSILPNLWMFFLWILLFGIYFGAKLYGVFATRFTPSFWSNVVITMLILVGPAVADTESGKDVYMAFMIRISLFLFVSLYAWWTLSLLDTWRQRRHSRKHARLESHSC
jgi:hypothetical protein